MPGATWSTNRHQLIGTSVGLMFYALGFCVTSHPLTELAIRVIALVVLALTIVRQSSLIKWTFFAILTGAELGVDFPNFAIHLHVFADIFLRLVRLVVAPLVFGTLTTGIAAHGQIRNLGRVALKTFLYFEVVTTLALLFGAVAINLSRAGEGVQITASLRLPAATPPVAQQPGFEQFLLGVFPENIVTAIAQNQILQIAVFSILFGTALALMPELKRAPLLSVLTSLTDTMFQFTRMIMYLAPIAAGAAISYTVGSMGRGTLLPLAKLLATFYGAALAFILLVFFPVVLIGKISVKSFVKAVSEPAAIGFATSTSESALPLAIERMQQFGIPQWIVSFVIPAGYSFNMDGASLYLSIASIFAAQVAGIHLTYGAQAVMLLTLMLTSKGIAGVPRATLMILLATAASFHLPTAPIMMILGVDALIDMGRTGLNVIGNCLAAAVIGKWESDLTKH